MNIFYLHLYAQFTWHDEAYICGTRDALTALRDSIDKALANGSDELFTFVNDGEGYSVHTVVATDEQMRSLRNPYTDEMAAACGRGTWPEDLLPPPAAAQDAEQEPTP